MLAAETRGRTAAQQAAGNLPWIGVDDASELQQLRADHATNMQDQLTSSLVVQKNVPVPMTRGLRCRKTEALLTNGTWMTVTLCVTQSWCYLFLRGFDVANAKVGAERNPLKIEVIHNVNDLAAERIRDVQSTAKISTVTAGSNTLGVAVGPRQYIMDQLLGKADRAMHEHVQL